MTSNEQRATSNLPDGLGPRLVAFCEELRREGLSVGTSEILDAFEALHNVPWTEPADFREAMSATLAKSQEERRVFDLLFERFFFRAAEAEALRQGVGERRRGIRRGRRRRPADQAHPGAAGPRARTAG